MKNEILLFNHSINAVIFCWVTLTKARFGRILTHSVLESSLLIDLYWS